MTFVWTLPMDPRRLLIAGSISGLGFLACDAGGGGIFGGSLGPKPDLPTNDGGWGAGGLTGSGGSSSGIDSGGWGAEDGLGGGFGGGGAEPETSTAGAGSETIPDPSDLDLPQDEATSPSYDEETDARDDAPDRDDRTLDVDDEFEGMGEFEGTGEEHEEPQDEAPDDDLGESPIDKRR